MMCSVKGRGGMAKYIGIYDVQKSRPIWLWPQQGEDASTQKCCLIWVSKFFATPYRTLTVYTIGDSRSNLPRGRQTSSPGPSARYQWAWQWKPCSVTRWRTWSSQWLARFDLPRPSLPPVWRCQSLGPEEVDLRELLRPKDLNQQWTSANDSS